jgi:hypothetical protein
MDVNFKTLNVVSNGIHGSLKQTAKMSKDAAQTVGWKSETIIITWTDEEYDKDGSINNLGGDQMDIQEAGIYLIYVRGAVLSDSTAGTRRHHYIRQRDSGGSAVTHRIHNVTISNSNNRYWNMVCVLECAANDYIEVNYYHDYSSGGQSYGSSTAAYTHVHPHICVVKLRD